MKYLLDTCTISYFLKGNAQVLEKLKTISPEELAVSVISVFEIEVGFLLKEESLKEKRRKWNDFKNLITILSFENEDAYRAAHVKSHLQKTGQLISTLDILIAATALCNNLVCVTSNTREFIRVPELQVIDWQSSH